MALTQNLPLRWRREQLIGDRYRVDRYLDGGSAGEVYSAQNVWTSRWVAVKRLLPDLQSEANFVERFLLEGRIGGEIEHPNIVQILDMGREPSDGSLFIVQELLRGRPLRAIITEKGKLSVPDAMDLVIPIVGALVAVHQQGIVHRDIKPENIFVLGAPFGQRIPKLLDFGIAKAREDRELTETGDVMGTLGYAAPEQLEGCTQVDRRADIWSIGLVLYELLSGEHPFHADNVSAAMYKIMHRDARDLHDIVPGCPKGISEIVSRTLRKNRQERPDSMLDLLEQLLRWSREEPDEFLRTLAIRHQLSIPSSLAQKLLPPELQPISRAVPSSSTTLSSSGAHVAVITTRRRTDTKRTSTTETQDEGAARLYPGEVLVTLRTPEDTRRIRTFRSPAVEVREGPKPQGADGSVQLAQSRRPAQKEPACDFGSLDFLDDGVDPDSAVSTGLVYLDAYADAATEALARNEFAMACDAANLLADREGMEPALRASMRVLQARGSFWLGDATGQETHATEALKLADAGSKQRFEAAAELACASSILGRLDNLLQLVDEFAKTEVSSEVLPDYLVGCCRFGIALQRAGWPEHVERLLGQVQETLQLKAASHPEVRAWSLLLGAELASHAGDHAHSLALTHDAAKAFAEQGDPRWACVCKGNAGFAMLSLGGYAEAREELGQAIRAAVESRISHAEAMRLNLGLAEARGGEPRAGLEQLRASVAMLGDSADWRVRSAGHRYLAEVLLELGFNEDAEKEARTAVELAASPALRAQALAMLALVQLPRPMEAFMAASQAMGMLKSVGGVAEDEARIRLAYAQSLDAMGHGDSAAEAYENARRRLLERAARISDPLWRSSFLERVREHEQTLALAAERCGE